MEIKYLGRSSFLIKTKEAKLVTDPFDTKMVGIKFPKVEADIVTVSHDHKDHNQTQQVETPEGGEKLIIDLPGEFEKKGVRVFGFSSFHDDRKGEERGENILYKIEADGVSVLHCGDMGFVPDDSFVDLVGGVDVLMIPVGGVYTINADQAIQFIKKIEPSIVIPMHYGSDKLAPVSEFLKKMGIEKLSAIPKLIVKPGELEEELKVVILEK